MSKRPLEYEDFASSTRYRMRARRRQDDESSSDESDEDAPLSDAESTGNVSIDSSETGETAEDRIDDPQGDGGNVLRLEQSDNDVPEEVNIDSSPLTANIHSNSDSGDEGPSGSDSLSEHEDNSFLDGSDSENPATPDPDPGNPGGNGGGGPPLYPGAPISAEESRLSILAFAMSHNISGSCLADLLSLVHLHCIQPCHCKTSLFRFMKYFQGIDSPFVQHFYCSVCFMELESKDGLCTVCNINRPVSYFVEVPLVSSLAKLFSRPGFYEKLNHRFERQKQNPDNYEDIYDGSLFKEKADFFSSKSNISLLWYTDGVKLFRSSKVEIWPLFFTINELPYSERTKPENMILAGLWFGQSKPVPELFLRPFLGGMRDLNNGVHFNVANIRNPVFVKCIVLCGTCDLPAKALFLNMTQYNGKFGCQRCESMGQRVYGDGNDDGDNVVEGVDDEGGEGPEQRRRGPGVQVYPFSRNMILRTDESTRNYAREAEDSGRPVRGVKGPSALLFLLAVDYITSTAVDVMHCLYSNVVSSLMDFWFLPKYNGRPFSMSRLVRILDERMKALTPPSFVQRLPRLISDRAHWKSSEFKNWFFYYSTPLLSDLMPADYFNHYKMLVTSMFLLNQSSISEIDVALASRLITEFVSRFEGLYGLRNMTCSIHSLLHFPDMVRMMGPLWTTSCFPYESLNGTLKSLVHGTRFFDRQICRSVAIIVNLPALKTRVLIPGSAAYTFCENMSQRSLKYKAFNISRNVFALGKYLKLPYLPPLVEDALDRSGIGGQNCYLFYRLLKSGMLYVGSSYTRVIKSKNTCVKYHVNGQFFIGILQCFVRLTECNCDIVCECDPKFYAIVRRCVTQRPFIINDPQAELSFVHLCTPDTMEAIELDSLLCVCFTTNVKSVNNVQCMYAVEPVNMTEKE